MRLCAWLSGAVVCLGMVAALPASVASGCSIDSEGTGWCGFHCEGERNSVGVGGSVSSMWLQWRTIEVSATCGGVLSATCAGHGSCSGSGTGVYGTGQCTATTGWGVDFTAGCFANRISGGPSVDPNDLPEIDPEDPPEPGAPSCAANKMVAPNPRMIRVHCDGLPGSVETPHEAPALPSADDVARVTITRHLGVVTATYCADGACVPVPVVCVGGERVACGVGIDAAGLRARYPDL